MNTKAGFGMMCLQALEHQGLPADDRKPGERPGIGLSLTLSGEPSSWQ